MCVGAGIQLIMADEQQEPIVSLVNVARMGSVDRALNLLAGGGVDIDQRSQGETPLYAASMSNHVPMVQLLLAKGSRVDTPSYGGQVNGAWIGSCTCVSIQPNHGYPAPPSEIRSPSCPRTPLHIACLQSSEEVVRVLIDAGANVNARGQVGSRFSIVWLSL
jgi:ankyrin repeat protein